MIVSVRQQRDWRLQRVVCAVEGCEEVVGPFRCMCERHWQSLPYNVQAGVYEAVSRDSKLRAGGALFTAIAAAARVAKRIDDLARRAAS